MKEFDRNATGLAEEKARLAAVAREFTSEQGFNARLIDYTYLAMRPFFANASTCLELGCADGRLTRRLIDDFSDLTAVDGSEEYVRRVQRLLPTVTVVHSLFEEYVPERRFDVIVMGHILEHVLDPVALLSAVRGWLTPSGRAIVSVPNADSLHRQVGVVMGLLSERTQLNESDLWIGHRRVYTRQALEADLKAAGLSPEYLGGVFLKPLSNSQIEQTWSAELQDAFFELGKSYPDLCGELLAVSRLGQNGGC